MAPEWPSYLGKPDVIVDLPAFNVPGHAASSSTRTRRVDNPFKEDTWLRAISIKPGDRSVLHHVVSNHVADPKLPRRKSRAARLAPTRQAPKPQVIAKDAGAPVPGGGKLNFQMHYTTTGKAATDHTQVGFYTLKAPPKYIKRSTVIFDFGLQIPAKEARHKEVAYITFPADMYIYTLYPHSHYRGYHVELMEKDADGKETMLLSLPKYDFNWQRDYDPIEPILVKKGTKLIATWVFDNSTNNKKLNASNKDSGRFADRLLQRRRPHGRAVAPGDDVLPHQLPLGGRDGRQHPQRPAAAAEASMSFGMVDDNYDGLIQETN